MAIDKAGETAAPAGAVACVACRSALPELSGGAAWWACPSCAKRYPAIGGRLPVLMADPIAYLARLYVQHKHYLRRLVERVEALRAAARSEPARAETLARAAGAYERNGAIFESFCSEIEGYLAPADVVRAIHAPEFVGYTASFEYLERDWCFLPEGERELAALRAVMAEALAAHARERGAALVLGAGTGRLAWDLLDRFDRVYALDASLVMAQQFQRVLGGGLTFQSVHTRSVSRDEDMVKERRARLSPDEADSAAAAGAAGRFHYLVSDAARIPLRDRSVSVVVSAYFTDVLPLSSYLGEVARVLEPGGLFLHIGPLEYHFEEMALHLSAEQIKRAFEASGFAVVGEERVTAEHLAREGILSHRIFDNWVLCAVRSAPAPSGDDFDLHPDCILELAGDVQFRVSGVLTGDGERTTSVELLLPSQEFFTGAAPVLDVLRSVDGATSVDAILRRLAERYAVEGAGRDAALGVLRELVRRRAVRVRSTG